MNEKGVFQTRRRQCFEIQVKMHVFAPSSARELLRELKRFQTSFSGHKCIKNVWRPGSARTRWESLSDPPDPLAVRVAASQPGWALRGHGGRVRFVGGLHVKMIVWRPGSARTCRASLGAS